ncbi:MAG: hypothetical protein ABI910_17145 [Gemmatimonadota bacterium]
MTSAGEILDVTASYLRTSGPSVTLTSSHTVIGGPGTLTIPLELDLTSCLSDPQRASEGTGCPVVVDAVLRDASQGVLDSTRVGPFDVAGGSTVSPATPVRLQAAADLVVEEGDGQLAWAGTPLQLPLKLRLTDRGGAPIAGRAVTLAVTAGGGTVLGGPFVTDAAGHVTLGYRVGAALGGNTVRASVPLGAGSLITTLTFESVPIRREHISAGAFHSCAIFRDNVTRCWGSNDMGLLGNPGVRTPGDTLYPVPVTGGATFVALADSKSSNSFAGPACGLTVGGAIMCWGPSPIGEVGLSGRDLCASASTALSIACSRTPEKVSGNLTFVTLDVGGNYGTGASNGQSASRICGVTADGEAYCWGENAHGAVGDSSRTTRTSPTRVIAAEKWIDVTTGTRQSCGVTVRGALYCWGDNSLGGLGTGDTVSSIVPRKVQSQEYFLAVDAGGVNTCARTLGGGERCWGRGGPSGVVDQLAPINSAPASVVAQFSVGLLHACSVDDAGVGFCRGPANQGLLGDGTPYDGTAPSSTTRAMVRGTLRFSEISAGQRHSCALTTTGDPYCWGQGSRGEVGSGGRGGPYVVPVKVTSGPIAIGAPATLLPTVTWIPRFARGLACPTPMQVVVLDQNGYPVPGASLQFQTRTSGASVSVQGASTDANGMASVGCTLSVVPGPNVFVVSSALLPGDSVVFQIVGAVPGSPASIGCVRCSTSRTVGTRLDPRALQSLLVTVVDASGLPVQGVPVQFSQPSRSGGQFVPPLPTTVTTDVFGIAALTSWRADTLALSDTVRAVVQGFPNNPQTLVVVGVADSPTFAEFTAQPPPSVRVGQFLPPVSVSIRDRYGNLVRDIATAVTLTLSSGNSSALLLGTTTVLTVNGVATFSDLRVNVAGTEVVIVASVNGLQSSYSAFFDVLP